MKTRLLTLMIAALALSLTGGRAFADAQKEAEDALTNPNATLDGNTRPSDSVAVDAVAGNDGKPAPVVQPRLVGPKAELRSEPEDPMIGADKDKEQSGAKKGTDWKKIAWIGGGAAAGAIIGFLLGGPIGALIGAALGGVSGWLVPKFFGKKS